MSKTYVIADIHGRFDLFQQAIEAIKIHSKGDPHTIITLGDYIDRGPNSAAVITALKAMNDRGEVICLRGNHEDVMLTTITQGLNPEWWIGNGGGSTLMSYGHPAKGEYNPSIIPIDHLDWISKLPYMHIDNHRIYVHAGVDPSVPLNKQEVSTLCWKIYKNNMPEGHGNYHVVHGHHQFGDGPKVWSGRTDLDVGAYYTGRLVVGVFDNDVPGSFVELLEIGNSKPTAD